MSVYSHLVITVSARSLSNLMITACEQSDQCRKNSLTISCESVRSGACSCTGSCTAAHTFTLSRRNACVNAAVAVSPRHSRVSLIIFMFYSSYSHTGTLILHNGPAFCHYAAPIWILYTSVRNTDYDASAPSICVRRPDRVPFDLRCASVRTTRIPHSHQTRVQIAATHMRQHVSLRQK